MSAMDFYCSADKVKGADGKDRVVFTFDGKYLLHTEQVTNPSPVFDTLQPSSSLQVAMPQYINTLYRFAVYLAYGEDSKPKYWQMEDILKSQEDRNRYFSTFYFLTLE